MAVTKDTVLARFPELRRFTDEDQWDAVLAEASAAVAGVGFPAQMVDHAVPYLVAHLLVATESNSGELQSISIGGVSKTFRASSQSGSGPYGSTSYGREFERMLRSRPRRIGVT